MEARGWGIVGVLGTTVIHSNVTESYTESHWAPERKRDLWRKQTFLTTTEKTACHTWESGFSHTRCPCQLGLHLQRTLLEGAGWWWWGGGC